MTQACKKKNNYDPDSLGNNGIVTKPHVHLLPASASLLILFISPTSDKMDNNWFFIQQGQNSYFQASQGKIDLLNDQGQRAIGLLASLAAKRIIRFTCCTL